jgi:hypothetical protein
MSGQPTPPRIVEAFALSAPNCDPSAPIAGGKTNPFPAASQISIVDGAASLVDGFVPLNMTDPTSGGIPPFGVDMNGILYLISSWAAFLAAGQLPGYDATLQAAMGGYALGARIQQAANTSAVWISTVAGNMTNPDTGGAGWLSSAPLYSAAALPGTNDVVLPGVSDYVIDIDTTSGARTITGFVAQRSWQKVTLCTTGVNTVQYNPLTGSAANNQIRLSTGGVTVLQNDSITFQFVPTINKWVQV